MADTSQEMQILQDTHKQLNDMFEENKKNRTTAEEQTANLNKQSQAAYQEQKIANQEAQNQFAQNQSANQLSALDAIRRSNASAIANGANAGLSAANQLSSILGLQEENSQAATELANKNIESAATYNTQLNENAVKGQELANQVNATADQNAAELAKSLATNADSIANVIAAERNALAQERAAGVATTTTQTVNPETGETVTTESSNTNAERQLTAEKEEADFKRASDLLTNVTRGWATGDGQTFATEYWDPFQQQMVKGGNQNNQSGGEAKDMERMAQKIQAKLSEAYNSHNSAEIAKWTAEATKFATTMKTENDACLVPGTLITLADGTTKPVEHIKAGDDLLVWDMLRGKIDTSPVLFVEHDKEEPKEVIKLVFSDATEVEFIYEHGFYDINLGRYVYLHNKEEATKLIGHKFFKYVANKKYKVKLVQVTSDNKMTTTHSPCTVRHLCLFANGILTMPGATAAFTNIFKVNKFKCKYSKFDVCRKIKKYGIFIPEDFAELLPKEIFYAFQGEFLKIHIAQGKTSMDEIKKLISRYAQYLK